MGGVRGEEIASLLVCQGCGYVVADSEPYPFRCPHSGDGGDHVIHRVLDYERLRFPLGKEADAEAQPFVRYRTLLHAQQLALAGGISDDAFVALVRELDEKIGAVEAGPGGSGAPGFRETPWRREAALGEAIGLGSPVFVKDETRNVAGSHKARHLFGVLVHLEVVERLGLGTGRDRPLAIASCGNAALAAGVVAAAGGWRLEVFVPTDADESVLERLVTLGAAVTTCPRPPGQSGDPTYRALEEAVAAGAVPFTCQGNLNGLAIEGGETLGYEIVSALDRAGEADQGIDHVVVQVGGGALGSAVAASFREARGLGATKWLPRFHTVQTEGAWPLRRAYERVRALAASHHGPDRLHWTLREAAHRREEFMWPWESVPHSIAHGILDDETYDWLAVAGAMLQTGGEAVVVGEGELEKANGLALETTDIPVDPTGSAGLAGLMRLVEDGVVRPGERAVVLFTGVMR